MPTDTVLQHTPVLLSTYMNNVKTIREPDSITTDVPTLSLNPVMVITAISARKLEEAPKMYRNEGNKGS